MQTAAEIKARIMGQDGPMPLDAQAPPARLGDLPPPDPVALLKDRLLADAAQPEPRGALRRFAAGTGEAFLGLPGTIVEGVGIATGSEALQEAGAGLQPQFVQPGEEGVIANLGRVLGSGAGFGGIAAGGARVAGMAGAMGGVGAAGAASAIPEAFYEAQASGADDETAWKAAMLSGLGQGALEVLGPERLIGRIASAMAKADRATGGMGRDLLLSTAGEAAEEGAQSLWADIAAQDLVDAVPDEPWADRFKQAAEQAGYGAFGGGVLGAMALAAERRAQEVVRPPEPEPTRAPYSPIERALTKEEASAVDGWRKARGATKAEVVERPELEEAVELARKAGVEVLFVEDDATAPKMDAQYDAGTIIMDARLDPASVGLFTGIHESIHALPKSKRDKLVKDLSAFSEKFRTRYGDKADRSGTKLTKAALDEEGVADLAGALAPIVRRVMRNPAGAMRVMSERPSLMRQIIDIVGGIFGKTATPKQLEALAEVSDRLALEIKPRERVLLAQKIVETFQGIQAQATRPIRTKNEERGLVVKGPVTSKPKGVAAELGAKSVEAKMRGQAAEIQRENETYRPGAIALGASDLGGLSLEEIQKREREAEAFERSEEDLTLRGAGFTKNERKKYASVRRRARLAQRALDMSTTEREAREARTELESAALELRRFEDRLTAQERERLRAGADPETYERLREARTSGLEARYGDVIEGSARERELQEQERRGVERAVPTVRYSLAYHGSPYDFDEFRSDRIGTGEGAQAYGWGLYFTDKKEIAKHYRDALSKESRAHNTWNGKRISRSMIDELRNGDEVDQWIWRKLGHSISPTSQKPIAPLIQDAIEGHEEDAAQWRKRAREQREDPPLASTYTPEYFDEIADGAIRQAELGRRALERIQFVPRKISGKVYEVDLAPSDDEYLLFDKPYEGQSEKVKAAIDRLVSDLDLPDEKPHGGEIGRMLMIQSVDSEAPTPFLDKDGMEDHGKAASMKMLAAGIRGVKYLDGNSRRAGDGGYNYVLFDDRDVKVQAKYSLRQTDTPEFRRWFGASKVVDGEGKPLVVYHGTTGPEFNTFNKGKIGTSTDAGYFGAGFYFVTDPEYAGMYAGEHANTDPALREQGISGYEQGGRILPVYLSIQNPYVIPWVDQGRKIGSDPVAFAESLREQGYDGIRIQKNPKFGEWYEWVAFEPEQIKSATGNRGTFDPANPDIRYSLRSDIESLAAEIGDREPESGYRLAAGLSMAERAVRAVVREQNPPDVRSVEEVEDDASKHLATPAARGKLVQRLLQGEMLNDAETLAVREIAADLSNDAWSGRTDLGGAIAVEQAYQALRTEQARALGHPALRDAYQSPAERLRSYMLAPTTKVQKELKKARTWQQRRAIFEREAKRVERIRYALAEKGWDPRLTPDGYYKDPNFVAAFVSTVDRFSGRRAKDAYIRWRRAALLSGPLTFIRNVSGSASFATYDRVLRLAADAMVPGSDTTAQDVKDYMANLLAAAPQAWQEAKGYYRDFYAKTMDGTTIDEKKGAMNVKGGPLRTAVEAVGVRAQSATDIFFRRMIEAAEIKLRQRQGLPDWDEVAKEDMERSLFLDRDKLTRAVTSARDWADTYAPIGTTLIPFASTPTKIVQRSAEIAAGPFAAIWRDRERGGTVLLGLATWGAILWMASMFDDEDGLPIVTGTRDRGGRGEFQDRVAPAYSVRVGNNYVSYQTFEPFAGVLAAVADAVQDGNDPMTGVQKFTLGVKDKSFFRSLEQVYDAVVASQDRWPERGGALIRDLLWTPMIPNVLRAPVRAGDESRRREIGDRLEADDLLYPALGEDYAPPLRYDLWGREASKPGGSWVGRILNPAPETRDVGDVEPLDLLLGRYYLENPKASYFSAPALFVTRNDEPIHWTEEEYAQLARESGQAAIERLRPWAAGRERLTERDIDYIGRTLEAVRKRTATRILKERVE